MAAADPTSVRIHTARIRKYYFRKLQPDFQWIRLDAAIQDLENNGTRENYSSKGLSSIRGTLRRLLICLSSAQPLLYRVIACSYRRRCFGNSCRPVCPQKTARLQPVSANRLGIDRDWRAGRCCAHVHRRHAASPCLPIHSPGAIFCWGAGALCFLVAQARNVFASLACFCDAGGCTICNG